MNWRRGELALEEAAAMLQALDGDSVQVRAAEWTGDGTRIGLGDLQDEDGRPGVEFGDDFQMGGRMTVVPTLERGASEKEQMG